MTAFFSFFYLFPSGERQASERASVCPALDFSATALGWRVVSGYTHTLINEKGKERTREGKGIRVCECIYNATLRSHCNRRLEVLILILSLETRGETRAYDHIWIILKIRICACVQV